MKVDQLVGFSSGRGQALVEGGHIWGLLLGAVCCRHGDAGERSSGKDDELCG